MQTEIFSFFSSLCEATSELSSNSASFESKNEILKNTLLALEKFVSDLHVEKYFHLRPPLVRLLFKYGAMLCIEEEGRVTSAGGGVGVDVLKVRSWLNSAVSTNASAADAAVAYFSRRSSS